MPFLRRGVPAIDLIDFDYGPNNAWWHTASDTTDKLSAASLGVTGSLVVEMIRMLEPR
jgi:Zn-dependent M28 family amino/carboxypeptidase